MPVLHQNHRAFFFRIRKNLPGLEDLAGFLLIVYCSLIIEKGYPKTAFSQFPISTNLTSSTTSHLQATIPLLFSAVHLDFSLCNLVNFPVLHQEQQE